MRKTVLDSRLSQRLAVIASIVGGIVAVVQWWEWYGIWGVALPIGGLLAIAASLKAWNRYKSVWKRWLELRLFEVLLRVKILLFVLKNSARGRLRLLTAAVVLPVAVAVVFFWLQPRRNAPIGQAAASAGPTEALPPSPPSRESSPKPPVVRQNSTPPKKLSTANTSSARASQEAGLFKSPLEAQMKLGLLPTEPVARISDNVPPDPELVVPAAAKLTWSLSPALFRPSEPLVLHMPVSGSHESDALIPLNYGRAKGYLSISERELRFVEYSKDAQKGFSVPCSEVRDASLVTNDPYNPKLRLQVGSARRKVDLMGSPVERAYSEILTRCLRTNGR